MKEIWRSIPYCQGYEASSLGRIRSINHFVFYKGKYKIKKVFYKGKILKPWEHNLYFYFGASIKGKKKRMQVNRAVCSTFHGNPPTKKHQAAHLDGNPSNNKKNNLRWVTCPENMSHKIVHGTMVFGEKHKNSKLKSNDIIMIRKKYHSGYSVPIIAKKYKICKQNVYFIINGEAWKHIPL